MRRLTLAAVCIAGTLCGRGNLSAYTFVPKDIDEGDGPRVYQLGNSHTDSMREELAGLAVRAGHKGYAYGTHTIPGAPLRWLRGHPKDSFEQLRGHAWDVVILQSYNSTNEAEIQAAIAYAAAAKRGNPDVRIIMYCIWPGGEDWDAPPLGRREEWNERVRARIRKAHPDLAVHVAPTSLVIRRVGNLADAARIPGLESRRDLYADAGHMGHVGAYAIACTMAAMIFQENPIGYPSDVLQAGGGRVRNEVAFDLGADTARAIQRVVWDTLAEYPHDGVDTGMVIPTAYLPPGVVGLACDEPLPIANAPQKPEWTVKAGRLPAGLEIADGRLRGTPAEAGRVDLTLRAEAVGETAERTVTLIVDEDKPLTIPEPDLPAKIARNAYIHHRLQARGGVGPVRWKVADGRLPAGLLLTDAGLLMGTAGKTGRFTPTLQARDRHPAGSRTARRRVTFDVGAADGAAIRVNKVIDQWKQDGKLDESFWSFDHVLRGADGKEIARFALAWYEDPANRRPEKTRHLLLAVKVTGRSRKAMPLEAVHVYLDCRHNREIIYNEDDLHYVVRRLEKPKGDRPYDEEIVQGYKHSRHFDEAVTVHADGTWLMEVEIGRGVFAGHGVHTTFGPNVTYGFDLAVGSADDPQQRVYWHGGPKADRDTSVFGSLVLLP
jgi:hypothetical protein